MCRQLHLDVQGPERVDTASTGRRRCFWGAMTALCRHVRRTLLVAVALAAAGGGYWAPVGMASGAARLRQLAPSVEAFASDGTRYVAWQVGEGAPIVALDTISGRRRSLPVPSGCTLEDQALQRGEPRATAGSGRFLLDCTNGLGWLLDVRTGTVALLPILPTGSEWGEVGSRYVKGLGDKDTCRQIPREIENADLCLALLDPQRGAIIDRAYWQAPDVSAPNAPPVCSALRAVVVAERDVVLSRTYSFDGGVIAFATHRGHAVEVQRCKGRPVVLHHRGEATNVDVRGGLLTWDTGEDPLFFPSGIRSATLTSYRLASGRRRSWTVPYLNVKGFEGQILGYSTHTTTTVFWIAVRAADGETVSRSALYAAPAP
jgi:hypothetical protein